MNDGNNYGPSYAQVYDASGCLPWLLVFILIGFGFMLAGRGSTTPTGVTTTNTRTNTEVMSRNQVNLFSDVTNCYGDGSCPSSVVTNTTTTVGDRNQVSAPAGQPVCLDPTTGALTSSACNGTYAGGQP